MAASRGNSHPLVVALTGGIAAGKSAVSERFAGLGVPVIDTDVIARELVEPGRPLLEAITLEFGADMVDGLGRLKRRKLRKHVFEDADARRRLEDILHPAILREAAARIAASEAPYCLLVIPLLAETGGRSGADRVLLVEADRETRIRRIMERDGVGPEEAAAAVAAQAGDRERRAIANDVIRNDGSLGELDRQVEQLHARYLAMAKDG